MYGYNDMYREIRDNMIHRFSEWMQNHNYSEKNIKDCISYVCETTKDSKSDSFVDSSIVNDKGYILVMQEFLAARKMLYDSTTETSVRERIKGKSFSFEEHVKGMIYSLLSSQRKLSDGTLWEAQAAR